MFIKDCCQSFWNSVCCCFKSSSTHYQQAPSDTDVRTTQTFQGTVATSDKQTKVYGSLLNQGDNNANNDESARGAFLGGNNRNASGSDSDSSDGQKDVF